MEKQNIIIKSHKDLASHIAGRHILHLNSLGKDSLASLHWLATFAPVKTTSLFLKRIASDPNDEKYLSYLKKKYPEVNFITEPNPWELNDIASGAFQSPIKMITDYNKWEHFGFDYMEQAKSLWYDYICLGHSKYESVTRATGFYKKGLLQGNIIYPLGLMDKEQVIGIVKSCGVRVHPIYKVSKSTMDRPSWYKMRNSFIVNPGYYKKVLEIYPLLELDKFRYERLFKL